MPKVNIESPFAASPRCEVGWTKGSGHVQVTAASTVRLDAAGVERLVRALRQASDDVWPPTAGVVRVNAPRPRTPATLARQLDYAQALA